ncbi:MAG: hypothetical protein GDA40_07785 [Rhodobacteraceae bacterium]|nr:hypothetical protein [Paracoccaceae bacterium]
MNINPAAQRRPTRRAAALALVALAALCAPSAGSAESPNEQQKQQLCEVTETLARNVMEIRQAGVSMSEVMKKMAEADAAVLSLARSIVIDAYENPRFSTPSVQKEAVEDFANNVALECYKRLLN